MEALFADRRRLVKLVRRGAKAKLQEYVRRTVPHKGQVADGYKDAVALHLARAVAPVSLGPFRAAMAQLNRQLHQKKRSRTQRSCRIVVRKPAQVTVEGRALAIPAFEATMVDDRLVVFAGRGAVSFAYQQGYQGVLVEVMPDGGTIQADTDAARQVVDLFTRIQTGSVPVERLPTFAGSCVWCDRQLSLATSKEQGAGDHCFGLYGKPLQEDLARTAMQPEVAGLGDAARRHPAEVLRAARDDGSLEGGLSVDDLRTLLAGFGVRDFAQACADVADVKLYRGAVQPAQWPRYLDLAVAAEHLGGACHLREHIGVRLLLAALRM